MSKKLATISLIGTIFLWGSSFIAIKIALIAYTPLELVTLRFIFASIILLIIAIAKKISLPTLKDLPLFICLAVVGVFAYHLLLCIGENLTTAAMTSFIVNIAPIFTIFMSAIFFKEKISLVKIIGSCIALAGVWFIGKTNASNFSMNLGLIVLLFAAVAWALFFILQKIAIKRYSSLETTSYAVWLATILFIIINTPHKTMLLFLQFPHMQLYSTLYLGIFCTALAYCLWAYSLKYFEVSKASICTYAVPIISAILANLLLGENYNTYFILGGSLILGGMFITTSFFKIISTARYKQQAPYKNKEK